MQHRSGKKYYGRNAPHRKAMFKNLAQALIKNRVIKTTLCKAKGLRQFVEPIITCAKVDNDANRKKIFAKLRDKESCKLVFEHIGPTMLKRPGGYTQIFKCGFRAGDNAPMAIIKLMDTDTINAKVLESKKALEEAKQTESKSSTDSKVKTKSKKVSTKGKSDEKSVTSVAKDTKKSSKKEDK